MTRSLSLFIALVVFVVSNGDIVAQEQTHILDKQHVVKLHYSVSPHETGQGLSYQYYPDRRLGIQVNTDYLLPIEGYHVPEDEYQQSGYGFRLNPELRFYTGRNKGNQATSFFLAIGPVLKTFRLNEYKWSSTRLWETSSYQRANNTNYQNFSYGAMGRIGVEAYFGKQKKIVWETSLAMGHMENRIRIKGDTPHIRREFFEIGADNKDENRNFYIDFRLGIGYRL